MRYYDIRITNPKGGLVQAASLQGAFNDTTFTSYVNGKTIGGALDIELDIPVVGQATPQGSSRLAIFGIGIAEVSQAFDLSLCGVTIRAGMQKGLPLANPKLNVAPIAVGTIFKPFGNWELNVMNIEMNILPAVGVTGAPTAIVFKCERGQPVGPAIQQALDTTFKNQGFTVKVAVSDKVVAPSQAAARYEKMSQFAAAMQRVSRLKQFNNIATLSGAPYSNSNAGGIQIVVTGKIIFVFDGTQAVGSNTFSSPLKIAFQDLIGQPTWIDPASINFKTVMRSDISIGDYVQLPPTLQSPYVLTTPAAASPSPLTPSRNKLAMKGTFVVTRMHHFGRFRQAAGDAWCTTFDATFSNKTTASGVSI